MMLNQGCLSEVRSEEIARDRSYIVIAMRFYPRFLRKELSDDFACALAPDKQLLKDFNEAAKRLGDHNKAFDAVKYLSRFELSAKALDTLKAYSDMSRRKDVYLVCICEPQQMCHREILLLTASQLFGTTIGEVFNDYSIYLRRLKKRF